MIVVTNLHDVMSYCIILFDTDSGGNFFFEDMNKVKYKKETFAGIGECQNSVQDITN
jgi:hypothetical protein